MCREGVQQVAVLLSNADKPDTYKQFFENSQLLLSNLEYNFKKDKMEFGNGLTKEKEEKRRKTLEQTKRKIEEVRDYSMKIIEVILHTNESDDEQQDFNYVKKHYEMLRNELSKEKGEEELEKEISELKRSKYTFNKTMIKNVLLDGQSQTTEVNNLEAVYENKIKELVEASLKKENQLKTQLSELSSDKQKISRQLNSWKKKYQDKLKNIKDLQVSLRDNCKRRSNNMKLREETVTKIIDMWQLKGVQTDHKND